MRVLMVTSRVPPSESDRRSRAGRQTRGADLDAREDDVIGLTDAAMKVHGYMEHAFLSDGAIVGPDPGVRFNYRIWRFLKGYTRWFPWPDSQYFLQCQGYWIAANWVACREAGDRFARLALAATDQIVRRQRDDGAWEHPSPGWQGRVATVEGSWATFACWRHFDELGARSTWSAPCGGTSTSCPASAIKHTRE